MLNKYNFQYFVKNIDIIFALIGIIIGFIIILLHYLISLNQLDIGFVLIASCLFYFLFKNSIKSDYNINMPFNRRHQILLNIIFFTFYPVVLLIYHGQLYSRPFSYFVLTSLLVGILSIEIIAYNRKNQTQLLFKILLLSITFWFETFYNFPSFSGSDSFWHVKIIQLISDTASIPPVEISSKYFNYPIFHILVSIASILSNINLKDSLFFTVSLSNLLCSIFIYLISSQIFNKKSGLIAVLLYNFSDSILYINVLNIIPGSLVLCYFLVILHIYYKDQIRPENRFILLFMTLISIITHQLSSFIVLISLLSVQLARIFHLYVNSSKVLLVNTKTYFLAFAVSLQFYWMFTYVGSNRTVFNYLIEPMIRALTTDIMIGNEEAVTSAVYYSTLSNILFHLGYLILLFISIGGIILEASSKDDRKFSMSIVSLILFSIIYGVPLLGIRNMFTGRWFPFLIVFLVILASPYFLKAIYLLKSKSTIIISCFIIFSVFTFFMITTPYINEDNPLYSKERFSRNQFKESEINALKIFNICSGIVKADRSYTNGIMRQINTNSKIEAMDLEYISSDNNDEGKLVLLRKCSLEEPVEITDPNSLGAGQVKMKLPISFFERYDSLKYNFIYNNGNVNGYLKD